MTQNLNPMELPLHGTRLIEASAGTGKTYTIAAVYLRLVLGHGGENAFLRALTPPEILVVTFTNAATEELRDRIRSRLIQAAAFFRGQGEGDDFLDSLRGEFFDDALPGKARLLEDAARWMDESAIHTIHAWCRRMLRQHAFDSGSLFDLELENDDKAISETAACDYWRSYIYSLSLEEMSAFLHHSKVDNPLDLLKKVRPFFSVNQSDDSPANPFDLIGQRIRAVERARAFWASDFSGAVDGVRRAREDKSLNGNKYREKSLENWIEQLRVWVEEKGPLPDKNILEKFSSSGLEKGVSKKGSPPVHPAYDAFDILMEELDGVDIDAALCLHGALEIQARVVREKKRLALMGFDDLLTRLGDALKKPGGDRLASVIREQFPVAMIDEFQDTDPVQYESFSHIYKGHADTFFLMIGDPKQAIYAFRGADIHTYLAARQDVGDAVYTLGRNYRSTKGVVNAVNQIFGAASDYPEGAFLFKDKIPFEPVSAQGTKDYFEVHGKPVKALTFWQMEQDEPINKTGEDGYIARTAESAAGEIVRLLNLAGLSPPMAGFQPHGEYLSDQTGESDSPESALVPLAPSDIAVLVRNKSEADAIRTALSARNISSVYLSDKDSVFETDEAADILYLLRACAEPTHSGYLRTALGTPVLERSFAWLDALNHDEAAWEAEVERFKSYQDSWQNQGVLPMIRRIILDFHVPSRLLTEPSGERRLTNLLHLSEILQSQAARLDGDHALIRWFARQIEEPDPGSAEDLILRLESDDELIRVVTIHKSKGLEYPIVFLPFICTFREVTGKNDKVIRYHDECGKIKVEQNPEEEAVKKADQERLEEDMRMLYVALTRAKYACLLGVGVMGNITKKHGEKTNIHLSGLGYILSGGEMLPLAGLSEALGKIKGDCKDIQVEKLPEPGIDVYVPPEQETELSPAAVFKASVPRNWWITSYSGILKNALMPETGPMDMDDDRDTRLEFPDSAAEDQLLESEFNDFVHIEDHLLSDSSETLSLLKVHAKKVHDETHLLSKAPVRKPDVLQYDGIEDGFEVSAGSSGETPGPSIHGFPRGPEPGTFLHDLLEWAANEGFDRVSADHGLMSSRIKEMSGRRGWDEWADMLVDWMQGLLRAPLELSMPFFDGDGTLSHHGDNISPDAGVESGKTIMADMALGDLKSWQCRAEMEFMFSASHVHTGVIDQWIQEDVFPGIRRPVLQERLVHGMLKGFIDLIFFHEGRYYIMDYKSNYLGENHLAYGRDAMLFSMLEHRYDLQYVLYTLALHRLLKARLRDYDYDRDVGGAVYLFLRGVNGKGYGVFTDRPSRSLIERLDDCFANK